MHYLNLISLLITLILCVTINVGKSEFSFGMGSDMKSTMSMIKAMQKYSVGKPNPMVGKMLSQMSPQDGRNADEMGTYMEGDILQTNYYSQGIRPRWPGGVIPYKIEGHFNARQKGYIYDAISEIERQTCIVFKPYTGQRDYIAIMSGKSGCWSAIGRVGGRQGLNLQIPGCIYGSGVAMHEFLHAIGFPHEHTRRDRDHYVQILTKNIAPRFIHNFAKTKFSGLYIRYDYGSIMHYGKFAFTRNGQPTIEPTGNEAIGQRHSLSIYDVEKVNRLYQCNEPDPNFGSEEDNSFEYRKRSPPQIYQSTRHSRFPEFYQIIKHTPYKKYIYNYH